MDRELSRLLEKLMIFTIIVIGILCGSGYAIVGGIMLLFFFW